MKWVALLLLVSACSVEKRPLTPIEPQAPAAERGPSAPAAGGTDFGGGGDLEEEPKAVHWFSGVKEVPYCIEVAPDFGVSAEAASELVTQSFAQWEKYIAERKLPESRLSIHAVPQRECDASTALVFLFGTWKPGLEEVRRRYRHPIAFAHKGGDVGYVWFASEENETDLRWNRNEGLRTMLLHELGHVYGNPHAPGTVMAADIASRLNQLPKTWIGEIDHNQELAHCSQCNLSVDLPKFRPKAGDWEWLSLRRLLGRDPKGDVSIRFARESSILTSLSILPFASHLPKGSVLTVRDEEGATHWLNTAVEEPAMQDSGLAVFSWDAHHPGLAWNGSVSYRSLFTKSDGSESLRLSLDFSPTDNPLSEQDAGPIRLRWMEGGLPVNIAPSFRN